MSRDFLIDVLEKFAQVTSILVETSKIKEDLDHKSLMNLDDLFKRTEVQIEGLLEHATSLKDFFLKHEKAKSLLNKREGAGDVSNGDLITESCPQVENDNTDNLTTHKSKPLIKLVDIKKLVEPRKLLKHSHYQKKSQAEDTVVIITSSDEDERKMPNRKSDEITINKINTKITPSTSASKTTPGPQINRNGRTYSRRKAAEKTIAKTKLSLQDSTTSDSDLSDVDKLVNVTKNGTKKRSDNKKVTYDDSSSSDSTSDSDSKKEENLEYLQLDWKTDSKFNSKCYVKVLRIPCEKLKEYYLEKLELLEINKLRNLKQLKRKKKPADSGSSTGCTVKKSKNANLGTEEHSDGHSSTSEDVASPGPEVINSTQTPKLLDSKEVDEMAENALDNLNSDKEDEDEGPVKNKEELHEKYGTLDRNEENSEALATSTVSDQLKGDAEQEKESSASTETSKPACDEDKTPQEENLNTDKQSEDAGESREEIKTKDTEREEEDANKEKKKWRNDKLLVSSSDSEEELEKFKKKKQKLQDDSSDGEPKKSQGHKSRSVKKRKKKAILSDSDSDKSENNESGSSKSSTESEEETQKKEPEKPKRKRVKRVQDSSDDDEENATRKQIRNILDRDSLAETTKLAEDEEKKRKARIAEKQKRYNQVYESGTEQNAKVEKVVLDYDEKNKKELLKVDDCLVSKLKPHQASGVQFMWDACFESLERAKNTKGSGCILAHCMGLGKTLQVITLCHTLLVNSEETKVKKILVVSPLNTVLNWVNEFKQWLPDQDDFEVFELVSFKQNFERQYQLKTWHLSGGVLIIGYDMFRNLSNPENKRLNKKQRATFQEALVDPGPDLVICDEGHLLKNEKTNLSIAMNRIKTLRRVILTGTPLQNNLKEYFCMVQFIKPNLLGTYKEYLNRFVNPITNGQYTDSTPHDIQVMRRRSHVLHKLLDGVIQRRDYSVLEPYLPPKFEYVLFLKLSDTQIKLYRHYLNNFARRSTDGSNRTSFLFIDFQALQRICTHPRVLLDKSIEMKLAKEKLDDSEDSEGSLKDFIDDDDEEEESCSSNSSSDNEDTHKSTGPRKRLTRAAAALAKESGEDPHDDDDKVPEAKEWWQEYCDGDELDVITHSSKLFLLFEILKECEQIGDKVLVFSQSLYSLNVIEYFLGKIHDATQAGNTESINGYSGSWCLGLDYFRLDGSSSCDNRNNWCQRFNEPENTRARLFLISTKAGGLGINLFAANRVIIFDVSWNPSHDVQSIYRVYRFGQTKPCYIYRFVTLGTMEMKIYERQVTKQAISKRVIDEQQIDRHYNQNDLAELYTFEPDPGERPIPLVPKDVLLGELLQKFEDRVYSYHEHQALLENKEEEGLNEDERKAAWEEFENEKKQRVNWGGAARINNLEIALVNVLRKDNPTLTDTQIRAMLPTLHAQMQEQVSRGDLTLYRQVHQEMQIAMALQNLRLKEQYQQQMLRALQHQQMMEVMKLHNSGNAMGQLKNMNHLPSTSREDNRISGGDIIELND